MDSSNRNSVENIVSIFEFQKHVEDGIFAKIRL